MGTESDTSPHPIYVAYGSNTEKVSSSAYVVGKLECLLSIQDSAALRTDRGNAQSRAADAADDGANTPQTNKHPQANKSEMRPQPTNSSEAISARGENLIVLLKMYGSTSGGYDGDDPDERKPAARSGASESQNQERDTSLLVNFQGSASNSETEEPDFEEGRKQRAQTEAGLSQPLVDLTTTEGQLAACPGLSEAEAKDAAKREYHRKHAARSRTRHKGLMKDLKEKVTELQKTNQELRATHEALCSQLRAYEHLERGAGQSPVPSSSLRSMRADVPADLLPRGNSHVDIATVRQLPLDLLSGFLSQPRTESALPTQNHLVGLQSLLQAHVLASPPPPHSQSHILAPQLPVVPNILNSGSPRSPPNSATIGNNTLIALLTDLLRNPSVPPSASHPPSRLLASNNSLDDLNHQLMQLVAFYEVQQLQCQQLPSILHGSAPWPFPPPPPPPPLSPLLPAAHPHRATGTNPSSLQPPEDQQRQQALVELILRLLQSNPPSR